MSQANYTDKKSHVKYVLEKNNIWNEIEIDDTSKDKITRYLQIDFCHWI